MMPISFSGYVQVIDGPRPQGLQWDETDDLNPAPVLLACPFCGQPPVVKWRRANPYGGCKTDGCYASSAPAVNLDAPQSVAAWNRRVASVQEPTP